MHMVCCAALDLIFLQDATPDQWRWLPDPNTDYSVSGAYHLLTHIVPLPTKENLLRRGMTHLDSILCAGVYGPLSNVVGDHASQYFNAYVFRKEVRI
ncbi:hypothetical protein A2U01_0012060, partial [Trifolium medium]|nr:hypothetical protein [Trifolium medium]